MSGVAAALMVNLRWSSLDLYKNVSVLQERLRADDVVPLEWAV